MIAIVPILVMIIGALVYALTTNAKAQELGRLAYAAGVFVTLLVLAGHAVRLLPT